MLSSLGNAAGFSVQRLVEQGRGLNTPAFAVPGVAFSPEFPEFVEIPGYVRYMLTLGGDEQGRARRMSMKLIFSLSAFISYGISITPEGELHAHLLAQISEHLSNWIDNGDLPTIGKWRRRLPYIEYTASDGSCSRVCFSRVYCPDGLKIYLTGPQNRACFVSLYDRLTYRRRAYAPTICQLISSLRSLHVSEETMRSHGGEQAPPPQKVALVLLGMAPRRLSGENNFSLNDSGECLSTLAASFNLSPGNTPRRSPATIGHCSGYT